MLADQREPMVEITSSAASNIRFLPMLSLNVGFAFYHTTIWLECIFLYTSTNYFINCNPRQQK